MESQVWKVIAQNKKPSLKLEFRPKSRGNPMLAACGTMPTKCLKMYLQEKFYN